MCCSFYTVWSLCSNDRCCLLTLTQLKSSHPQCICMQCSLLSKRPKDITIAKNHHISLVQSNLEKKKIHIYILLLHYNSIPANWSEKSLTRAKWHQEELFCSAFIFLMNLSLSCGHSYRCWDGPESCSDQLERRTWLEALQADFKPEEEESSSSRRLWRKSDEKLFSCRLMPGLENVACDVCTVREPSNPVWSAVAS